MPSDINGRVGSIAAIIGMLLTTVVDIDIHVDVVDVDVVDLNVVKLFKIKLKILGADEKQKRPKSRTVLVIPA